MGEIVDIVDEEDNVIGKGPIDDVRQNNQWFRVARIIVVNSSGKFFVHQRSWNHVVFPGHYDFGAAGIVSSGEDYATAAKRELEEEIGAKKVPLRFVAHFKREGPAKTQTHVYCCTYDGAITIQEDEIIHGRFMTGDEIEKLQKKEKFHPGGVEAYRKYLEWRRKM